MKRITLPFLHTEARAPEQGAPALSRRAAMRYLAGAGMAGLTASVLAGCGGGSTPVSPTGTGAATLVLEWPDLTTRRLVPVAATSIVVRFHQGGSAVASQTVTRPSSGTTSTVTFAGLPTGVLTVTATAYPTPTGSGIAQATATTTATILEGQTTPVSLTLASTISTLRITPVSPSLTVGGTVSLAVTGLDTSGSVVLMSGSTLTWTSLSASVATVDSTGLVTGAAVGTAQIHVSDSESGTSATVSVTVSAPVTSCHLIPSETDGPYPLYSVLSNPSLIRSTINESKTGVPLTIELTLAKVNGSCAVVPNAYLYLWHCDKDGTYSGYSSAQNGNHLGETYCRGIQKTDSSGKVVFQTIYPGWYAGRITHVHFQVYLTSLSSTVTATSQFAFPQEITQAVYASTLYTSHGQNTSVTGFAADNVFSDGTTYQMATLTGSLTTGYTARLVIGINA